MRCPTPGEGTGEEAGPGPSGLISGRSASLGPVASGFEAGWPTPHGFGPLERSCCGQGPPPAPSPPPPPSPTTPAGDGATAPASDINARTHSPSETAGWPAHGWPAPPGVPTLRTRLQRDFHPLPDGPSGRARPRLGRRPGIGSPREKGAPNAVPAAPRLLGRRAASVPPPTAPGDAPIQPRAADHSDNWTSQSSSS